MKDKKKITAAAATAHKKILKIRPSKKYNQLFSVLMTRFEAARSKGYSVDFNWLWCKARVVYREITGSPNATVRQHVITTFLKRHNIRMRARQRNRKTSKPEGLKGYVVPTPSLLEPSVSLPQAEENIVAGEEHAMEEVSPDEPEEPEHHSSSKVLEDKYHDRDFHEELVGSKVTALYENGWFTGTVEYYNTKLKEYKVNYHDDSSDFLSPDDFDGVEVILEPL